MGPKQQVTEKERKEERKKEGNSFAPLVSVILS